MPSFITIWSRPIQQKYKETPVLREGKGRGFPGTRRLWVAWDWRRRGERSGAEPAL